MSDKKNFDIEFDADGKIIDFLTGKLLHATPEEKVRQRYIRILHIEYRYPKEVMRREVSIKSGHSDLKDMHGQPIRADIVIYYNKSACANKDQGQIFFLVECKAPTETDGYSQLVSYIFNTSATGGIWFNDSGADDEVRYYRRIESEGGSLKPWIGVPRFGEGWDSLGRRKKDELLIPKDIRGLLRRCHNKLHGRGNDSEEEDLTMDMVRLLLAKAMDEEGTDPLPDFYCTPDEYEHAGGHSKVKARIDRLFDNVKRSNPDVFSRHEAISVSARAICDVVIELQDYQLLSESGAAHEWDIMGHAYEQYASVYLKREKGQYFTNRLVVDLMVSLVTPDYLDIILDPAGGSGGFLTGVMRHVRSRIFDSAGSDTAKHRQLDKHRTNLFMVEASKRLVKVAKTAMILNGDGHTGMTAGDSLGSFKDFDKTIIARANRGTPNIILTNPPFAGVGEGRVTHPEVLRRFQTGKRWEEVNSQYSATQDLLSEGAPPELLFLERCIDWLAPKGRLGIVMPKGFLDTKTYRPGREMIFQTCRMLAVINLHKDTFQPYTGVRTCVIILEKLDEEEKPSTHNIFMAISHRVGQDSEGRPVYVTDQNGDKSDQLDHDLDEIRVSYEQFRAGLLPERPYIFSISSSDLGEEKNINPQRYLPHLNETLQNLEALDSMEGWSVRTIGTLTPEIKIFKGPRLKSENLITDAPGDGIEPYYTPSAILQEKSDSVKYLEVKKATEKQLSTINSIRVMRGDIVITRSGSIGRVSMIPEKFHNAIVSDDLIRVRIPDEVIRNFVFSYLQTKFAVDQMKMNEYGSIQQHLEPQHVRQMLIPMPDSEEYMREVSDAIGELLELREAVEKINTSTTANVEDTIRYAINGISE